MLDKWDKRFLELSQHIATWSKDPSTQTGAVIVDWDRKIRGLGYNGFPRNVKDLPERYEDRAVKYKLVVHSEANAILNADKNIAGCLLYTTKFPCSDCAKLIIQSGIGEVIYLYDDESSDKRWAEDGEFSKTMFSEARVAIKPIHRKVL